MKKVISLIIAIVLSISYIGLFNVSAAGTNMYFSNSSLEIGDELTVTVKVTANEKMYSVQFALNYDPTVLEFISGDDCSGGAGIVSVTGVTNSISESYSFNFKAIKSGSCYISATDVLYSEGEEELSISGQSASITVKDVTLSGNANLKSLSVNQGSLSPKFSASTTSYKVTVGSSVTECKVYATADDPDAKVQVEGGKNLKVGENKCTVTVTAANGTQKIYNIVITRQQATSSVASSAESSTAVSSKNETSSLDNVSSGTNSSSEEESSDTDSSSQEDNSSSDPLSAKVDGTDYTVATDLEGIALPSGFSVTTALYNGEEVAAATDNGRNYTIYYLSSKEDTKLVPYVLDENTLSFKKLQYIEQNKKAYIFAEAPSDFSLPEGYYATSTSIADFNVICYASEQPELSAFYYVYCFNGSDFGFYRYDSMENVIQRYPEMTLSIETDAEPIEQPEGLAERFASLTTNAKIVVIGIAVLIIALLALIILLVFKIISNRHRAAFVNSLGYEDFDDIDYNHSFSMENGDFLTTEEEVEELDFSEDATVEETPDYLVDENEDIEDTE